MGRIDASQGDHLRAMQNDLAVEAREGLASGAGLNWSFETYRRRRLERYAVAEGNRLLTWTLDQLAGGLDQFDPADPDVIAVRSHIADQRAEALFSEDDPDVQSMDAQVDQAIGDWEGRARREGRAAQIAEVDRECADTFTDCVTCKAGDQP